MTATSHEQLDGVGFDTGCAFDDAESMMAGAGAPVKEACSPPALDVRHGSTARVAVLAALAVAALVGCMSVAARGMGAPSAALVVVACAVGLGMTLKAVARLRAGARSRRTVRRTKRIALIGSQASAVALEQRLASHRIGGHRSVGWIAPAGDQGPHLPLPGELGSMDELASLVECHRIDLLLIGAGVPRLRVFDELVRLTDVVDVRVCECPAFYEDTFGHIPVDDINSAWFQYMMHPKFSTSNRGKRAFDLAVCLCLGIVGLPIMLLAALLIKLDGGQALYRQPRIGEKGRPFTIYKLRTMRERRAGDGAQSWCSVDDPRVTRVGRVLRALHLDELPQLYNVLRGEMSVVGPRPEQSEIVERLESEIAFYSRRHMIKPGLAGWAQLRCGYARTERASEWKLCHDLYYVKHQSLRFDLVILLRTFLMLTSQIAMLGAASKADAPQPPTASDAAIPVPVLAPERELV